MMVRLFAAFPIMGTIAQSFSKIAQINSGLSDIRWTPEINFHITLFFIGEVQENNVISVLEQLTTVRSKMKPFQLNFDQFVVKRKGNKPVMIWAQWKKNDAFRHLHKLIMETVSEFMTISVSHQDPIPHCTLARIKNKTGDMELNLEGLVPEEVILIDRAELWRTNQSKSGIRYECLGSFAFVK